MSTQHSLDHWTDDHDHPADDHEDDGADWKRLQEGAAYRQTARDTTTSSPDIDTECQGCQGHVTKRFVRVFGVDGQVWDCPQCASARDIMGGPFADSGPGGQG